MKKFALYLIPTFALLLILVCFLVYGGQPFYHSGIDWTLKPDGFNVLKVVSGSDAYDSGLRSGDLVVSVDGIDAVRLYTTSKSDMSAFLAVSSGIFRHGHTLSLVLADGTSLRVPVGSMSWRDRFRLFETEVIVNVSVGVIFVLAGFWLLTMNRRDSTVRWFLGFTTTAGVALASSYFSSYWSAGLLELRFLVLDVGGVGAAFFLTGFVRRFPKSEGARSHLVDFVLFAILAAKYVLIATGMVKPYGAASYLVHVSLALTLPYVVFLLVRRYRDASAGGKRKLRWLFAGIGLSLLPYITYMVTVLFSADMLNTSWGVFNLVANSSILFFPVFVGIGVVRYNLFDIDRFINRFTVLFLMAFLATLAFALVFLLVLETHLSGQMFAALLATALVSPGIYLKLDSMVDRLLAKGRKDRRQILVDMEQELVGVFRKADVYPIVSTALVYAFDPRFFVFYRKTAEGPRIEYAAPPRDNLPELPLPGSEVVRLPTKDDSPLLLLMGPKRDEDIYTGEDMQLLAGTAAQITKSLENCELYSRLEESLANESTAQRATILSLAKLTEYRDNETGRHLERIQEYSRLLALRLKDNKVDADYLNDEYIEALCLSSVLHDIGKVGIPDHVLLKPGKLTAEEFEEIKRHTLIGGRVLEEAEALNPSRSFLSLGKLVAYHHHERWDGTGYPFGLAGNDIPLSARIVAVADVYDALRSDRPYKTAYSHQEAMTIIRTGSGSHFDPAVVEAFVAIAADVEMIAR